MVDRYDADPNASTSTGAGGQGGQEGQQGAGTTGEGRPTWLPENFNSPEDLAKSYKEAQAELTRLKQSQSQGQGQGQNTGQQGQQGQEADESTPAGKLFNEAVQKSLNGQGLTNDDYAELERQGFDRDTVSRQIEGIKAQDQAVENRVYETVGSKETYQTMVDWAAQNLSKEAIDAYDRAVQSGDPEMARIAAAGLKAQYEAAEGTTPTKQVNSQGNAGTGSNSTYGSWQEVQKDMATRDYKKDPAFRAQVEAKLARSNI